MVEKPIIDAKEALDDIRSGMTDSALMQKYNLSPIGLQSLIGKLVRIGALREIGAGDLLRDLRSGVTNNELMKKYELSAHALTRIFNEMTDAGISFFRERRNKHQRKKVDMTEFVSDIRAGATERRLMERHGLSSRGLQSAFWKLVRSGVMTWDELLQLYPGLEDSVTLQKMRQSTRSYPILSVEIYEEATPENRGKIKDLSEKGFGVTGLQAEVNDRKRYVIVPNELLTLRQFTLEAECKWFSPAGESRTSASGFQIIRIDEDGSEDFDELVHWMTLTFE